MIPAIKRFLEARSADPVLRKCRAIYREPAAAEAKYAAGQKDYDKSWQGRLDRVISYIERGERSVPGIFARDRKHWMAPRWKQGELVEFVASGKVVELLAVSGYVYYRNAVAQTVISVLRPNTVAIIELGSGQGESVFSVWSEASDRLRDVKLVMCEFSVAGRKVSRMMAVLDPTMDLETRYFDYRSPSFDGLELRTGHVVVLSTHSIEQVDEVSDDLIDKMLGLGQSVTGVHFEPIGWQFATNQNLDYVRKHKERCQKHNYNQNYWGLLQKAQNEGKIRIVEAEPYFFGFEYNPPSRIIWESV
jgi:hypothetical protein